MTPPRPAILKPKDIFRDTSGAYTAKRRRGYTRMALDCLRFLAAGGPVSPPPPPAPFSAHDLEPRFFAMNVCPSPDEAGDAVILDALRDLNVAAVRIDYGQRDERRPAERLIRRLADAAHPITLHLVQDPRDAAAMDDGGQATREWRAFVDETLNRHGHRIEALEVGSTPNRHSWSGYTTLDYAAAAHAADDALKAWSANRPAPLLVGPNISDFAPYFTVGQLAECHRRGVRFDAMSDNLFIDRVGEPEAYDPHVLGQALRAIPKMDLVRKQRVLAAIARRFGSERAWCTYTHYTLNFGHERRRYVSENEYADYMTRLHLLTAAAGQFQRVYWGTLVSHHKGLIDEGLGVRPYPPFVHHRFATNAPPAQWRRRNLFFRAYATMTEWLSGARFVRRTIPAKGVTVLELQRRDFRIGVGWTRDRATYNLDLAAVGFPDPPARIVSRDGQEQPAAPRLALGPSPVYWQTN